MDGRQEECQEDKKDLKKLLRLRYTHSLAAAYVPTFAAETKAKEKNFRKNYRLKKVS
jgi:hypothetical protein